MLEKLKHTYAGIRLRKEAADLVRQKKDPDIHSACSIGILYDATEREQFELVRELYRDLRNSGKNPVSLGYIDFKEPFSFHSLARPEADYFFKTNLNWFQKPSSPVVENFISEPFDFLILLSTRDHLPLDFVAARSKAGVKIGRAGSAVSFCFDMSFFIEEGSDLKVFAYTIIHYLSQINHESSQRTQRNRSSHYYTV